MPVEVVDLENATSSQAANGGSPLSQTSSTEETASSSFDEDSLDYGSDADADSIKLSLEEFLSGVKTAGSFATSGVANDIPLSGLSVRGVGPIGFPLGEQDAKAMIGACHQAPFGKGSETIIDENVRKTWELNPDQFEISNPAWQSVVVKLATQATQELGCAPEMPTRVNLYKLLLYEEGAMFKPHKDTEKEPGMFGTLVICLPSKHEGGEIVASHRGYSKTFQTGSAFSHTYIAWYADVKHEVKPITSGYRLVLVYNLVQRSTGPTQSAAILAREKKELSSMLGSWARGVAKEKSKAPMFLIYQFDYEYTDTSLRFETLKGLDKVKAEYLREICSQVGVGFYLASMERTEYGPCDEDYHKHRYGYDCSDSEEDEEEDRTSGATHTLEEVLQESIQLKRMIDLGGSLIARDISIQEEDIVQEDPFSRDPDKEDFEGYTGNAGASATHFYHDIVAVLVPFTSRHSFLSSYFRKGRVDINAWMQRLIKVVQTSPHDKGAKDDLLHLTIFTGRTLHEVRDVKKNTWEKKDHFPAPEPQWPVLASLALENKKLFDLALTTSENLPLPLFTHVGGAMFIFELPITHGIINQQILRFQTFHTRYQALKNLIHGFQRVARSPNQSVHPRNGEIQEWARIKAEDILHRVQCVIRDDGICLADMAINLSGGNSIRDFLPFAKRFASSTAFTVAFATAVRKAGQNGGFHKDEAREVFVNLARDIVPKFEVEVQKTTKRERSGRNSTKGSVLCLADGHDTALFLNQIESEGLKTEALEVLGKLEKEAASTELTAFEDFFLPLLRNLIQSQVPLSKPGYQRLFRQVLLTYAQRYVQTEPASGDWACEPEGCGCSDCDRLDRFLADPSLESKRFPVSKSRRHHLHCMLNDTEYSHETDRRGVETLVVTKPASRSQAKYEQWKKRFFKARQEIKQLDQRVLQELLGEDYEYLTQLRAARRKAKALPSARKAPRTQQIEFVDLT